MFKPHTDGDWPGSGLINGKLHLDAFGDKRSAYTLVLYLKDDFEGGETAFYLPRSSVANPVAFGDFDRISVPAVAGAALVFPHGADPRSPVHEGATVSSGTGPSILSEPTCCTGPDSSSPHELARHRYYVSTFVLCVKTTVVRQIRSDGGPLRLNHQFIERCLHNCRPEATLSVRTEQFTAEVAACGLRALAATPPPHRSLVELASQIDDQHRRLQRRFFHQS